MVNLYDFLCDTNMTSKNRFATTRECKIRSVLPGLLVYTAGAVGWGGGVDSTFSSSTPTPSFFSNKAPPERDGRESSMGIQFPSVLAKIACLRGYSRREGGFTSPYDTTWSSGNTIRSLLLTVRQLHSHQSVRQEVDVIR